MACMEIYLRSSSNQTNCHSADNTCKMKTIFNCWRVFVAFGLSVVIVAAQNPDEFALPCEGPSSDIYCHGLLLETVQRSEITPDNKDFVDYSLVHNPEDVLTNFEDLIRLNCTGDVRPDPFCHQRLEEFVNFNFENGTEFETVNFTDWIDSPDFINDGSIFDPALRNWALELHKIWNDLGRQIKPSVQFTNRTSIVYSPNPMVVPGGRFREFYYWDSYWIQRGLLVSGMKDTVRGMVDNFLMNVDNIGYVPNGGRIYYERTQPPLLLPMVHAYYNASRNVSFIRDNFRLMEKEFAFFMNNRTVNFMKDGKSYTMAVYKVDRRGPRPESFAKEFCRIDPLPISNTEKNMTYSNLKSACESGWDFSSRWFKLQNGSTGPGQFKDTRTRDIVPVDLNAFLYWNAVILEEFCNFTQNTNCSYYTDKAAQFKTAIHEVLWDEATGSWYDYDYVENQARKGFYPTNLTPLWTKAHHIEIDANVVEKVARYLVWTQALKYPGGIPTSLINSTEQWDFPNAWPPLIHMVVEGLERSGNANATQLAFQIAQTWTNTTYLGWAVDGKMYEKYDVRHPGCRGFGGYYATVLGFGWTNGINLDFLMKFGDKLVAPPIPDDGQLNCPEVVEIKIC